MAQLVAKEKEPITPLVQTIRSLYDDCAVSSVLVIGGTGDYFEVADNVLVLDSYVCNDATVEAKTIVAKSNSVLAESSVRIAFRPTNRSRRINGHAFVPNGKVKTLSQHSISYGTTDLDLRYLEQLVCKSQTSAIACSLQRLPSFASIGKPFTGLLKELDETIDTDGLDALDPGHCNGRLSRPRSFEIAGAVNRFRVNNCIQQQAR